MIRFKNVDRHYGHVSLQGAHILQFPADYPFGERQYTAEDIRDTGEQFSQSIKDVVSEIGVQHLVRPTKQTYEHFIV
jgi:hypothetical protein